MQFNIIFAAVSLAVLLPGVAGAVEPFGRAFAPAFLARRECRCRQNSPVIPQQARV